MKKVLLAIASLLLLGGAQAQQVKWHTMAEASSAKIGSKMYFVDFYTTWCGYCKRMDSQTFTDPTVAKILNKYFYPVKFNAEGSEVVKWNGQTYSGTTGQRSNVHQLATAVLGRQMGFPTFVLLKADQTVIQSIPGYYPPRDFVVVLWYFASGDCDKYPFDRYQQIFDREIRPIMERELDSDAKDVAPRTSR